MQNSQQQMQNWFSSVLSISRWFPSYNQITLRSDLQAALMIAAFTIPESMAYAALADLPPQVGLYSSLLAPLAYVLFGTSRHLIVGPTSALSILLVSELVDIANRHNFDYAAMATLTSLIVGAISIAAWVLRLGFVSSFISEPVLVGTSAGAACVIGASQVSKLLGIQGARGEFFERIGYIIEHSEQINLTTFAIGLAGILLLIIGEKYFHQLPIALIVVLLSIGLMSVTNLTEQGVMVVGQVPQTLPHLAVPAFTTEEVLEILPLGFSLFVLSYVEGISIARTLSSKYRYHIDPNQELLALGVSNLAVGLFQGYPVGGSMSRSTVNAQAGGSTPVAGGIASLLLTLIILFLVGMFGNLPKAMLAALVLVAVKGLIDFKALREIYRVSRREFIVVVITFSAVLFFGILNGVLIGIVVSLIDLLQRVTNPHWAILGRLPGTDNYRDISLHPQCEKIPGVLIYRLDASLFFANSSNVYDQVIALVDADPSLKLVLFNSSASPMLDLTGAAMLHKLYQDLAERQITLKLVEATGQVRDVLQALDLELIFGKIEPNMTISKVIVEWLNNSPLLGS